MRIAIWVLAALFAVASLRILATLMDNPKIALWLVLSACLALGIDWLDKRLERLKKGLAEALGMKPWLYTLAALVVWAILTNGWTA